MLSYFAFEIKIIDSIYRHNILYNKIKSVCLSLCHHIQQYTEKLWWQFYNAPTDCHEYLTIANFWAVRPIKTMPLQLLIYYWFNRIDFSRMCTACSLPYRGSLHHRSHDRGTLSRGFLLDGLCTGGLCPGGLCSGTKTPWTETPPVMWPVVHAGTETPLWTEWHIDVKTLRCPKLRLRAVIKQICLPFF